jgi:hypothetical protein
MAKLTLWMNSVNANDRRIADDLKSQGVLVRYVDICGWESSRYPQSVSASPDRALRVIPTLLVDNDTNDRELERQEGSAIDPVSTKAKLDAGAYNSMTGTPIVDPNKLSQPGELELQAVLKRQELNPSTTKASDIAVIVNEILSLLKARQLLG